MKPARIPRAAGAHPTRGGSRTERDRRIRVVRMSGRGSRFLHVVRDLGHLDDDGVEQVMLAVAAEAGDRGISVVDLAAVRRHVAVRLLPDLGAPGAVLSEDWPLLFS